MDYVLAERSSVLQLARTERRDHSRRVADAAVAICRRSRGAPGDLVRPRVSCQSEAGQLHLRSGRGRRAMDAALDETLAALTGSGIVSAASNRKAMRIGQESLEMFRQYMAMYCREQAYLPLQPAIDCEPGAVLERAVAHALARSF
jgi:hypothetical protein